MDSPDPSNVCVLNGQLVAQGNINLIEAALAKGVKKFVLVTSIGTGDSKDAPPSQVYDVLKPVLLEKEKAEERLKVCPIRSLKFPLHCKRCCWECKYLVLDFGLHSISLVSGRPGARSALVPAFLLF